MKNNFKKCANRLLFPLKRSGLAGVFRRNPIIRWGVSIETKKNETFLLFLNTFQLLQKPIKRLVLKTQAHLKRSFQIMIKLDFFDGV